MAGQRPRKGWIYRINPFRVSLTCRHGHQYFYNLTEPSEIECQNPSCSEIINSSRVLRGTHPYIIWENDQFQDNENYIQTFSTIPLTSQTTYSGLSTVYPITKTTQNGLDKKSYALVHQICTVDSNCFKNSDGDWLQRIGQLSKKDKEEIQETLLYYLDINNCKLDDDWLHKNASPELVKKIFDFLPDQQKQETIENLIDEF